MGCLGNIIWMLCGGLVSALGYLIAGCIWCITIVESRLACNCFKLAGLALFSVLERMFTYGGGLWKLFY